MVKGEKQQIENMRKLGYSDAEIEEMLADDAEIQRSGINDKVFDWELDPKEHKEAMKLANVSEYKPKEDKEKKSRPRKPNPEKRDLIDIIYCALQEAGYAATVSNPEKTVEFAVGEQKYSVNLTAHRKPK